MLKYQVGDFLVNIHEGSETYVSNIISDQDGLLNQYRLGDGVWYSQDYTESHYTLKSKSSESLISSECDNIKRILLDKNKKYGDSALNPVRVFSKLSPLEQLKVRIDDKLSRINNTVEDDEDVTLDLLGYIILYRIAKRNIP